MNAAMNSWMLLLGQATTGGGAGEASSAVTVNSFWDFAVKGGPMMIPIAICSLVALTVIFERLVTLRRRNIIPPGFLPGLKKTLDDDGDNRADAIEYCRNDGSPVANIFTAGIKKLGESIEVVERHIEEAGRREVFKLRRYLRTLSVVASIAPLMGLLGTVFGMIVAFQTVATSGEALGKAELLAKGIYQAMISTAAGLLLALPVIVAYHYFSARIDRIVSEMDLMTVEFVEDYAESHVDALAEPKLRATKEAGESGDRAREAKLSASVGA